MKRAKFSNQAQIDSPLLDSTRLIYGPIWWFLGLIVMHLLLSLEFGNSLQLYGIMYSGPFGHFFHKMMDKIFKGKKGNTTVAKKVNHFNQTNASLTT